MNRFEALKRTLRVTPAVLLICVSAPVCAGQVPIGKPGNRRPPAPMPAATSAPVVTAEPSAEPPPPPRTPPDMLLIPGPLRSFLRMAGMSQKAPARDILPLLSQRVYQTGFQDQAPTEFLILLQKYVRQARELQVMAGPKYSIDVASCAEVEPLLKILGYRLRRGCVGRDTVLETANPERAFLTIDSGFPLADLEEALDKGLPFSYAYAPSPVPVLFHEADWTKLSSSRKYRYGNCLDVLLNDPLIARLYYAVGNTDFETQRVLRGSIGLYSLLGMAPVLDFYGSQISVRSGRVLVPGGAGAEAAWRNLVGANPQVPGPFISHLLSKDEGWLAAYFDVLSRVDPVQQERLTQMPRLQRYFESFRAADLKNKAAFGTFRKASQLLVLDTRLRWDADGSPHVPGSLAVWQQQLQDRPTAKMYHDSGKRGRMVNTPDQLVEMMSAAARDEYEAGPLQLYLTLCELDRRRPAGRQVSAETVTRLALRFQELSNWYLVFSEFPALTDEAIVQFLDVSKSIEQIHNQSLRANALGAFEANLGLWQILARQHEIPEGDLNASWKATIEPFAKVSSPVELFDGTRHSFRQILQAAGSTPDASASVIVDKLAGPVQDSVEGRRIHDRLAARIRAVLEDQQLVSLDTLFALGDGLGRMAQDGTKPSGDLLSLAGELRGFELPRPVFTNSERISWAPAVYTNHHVELQVQTDLTKILKSSGSHAQMENARGQLAPFLRDTLVGLNYAYYEPPGAQILHANPLFVRAHDFLCISITGTEGVWQPPVVVGAGVAAGGGAYLMGSLIDLPFSLATAEQDFIVPENVQALIWKELVPVLMTSAMVPRYWAVTPGQLHAVALYQRAGDELLRTAATDAKVRGRVLHVLSRHLAPQRLDAVAEALVQEPAAASLLPTPVSLLPLMPSETLYLAEEYRRVYTDGAAIGPYGKELDELALHAPADVDRDTLCELFGVPHPTLGQSNARSVLNVRPFPFSGGIASRLFAESIESSNLYWARLADELGYSPAMLHLIVPELTRLMAGKIFATNFDDLPAVIRAMQEAGEDLRQGRIASLRKTAATTAEVQPLGPR